MQQVTVGIVGASGYSGLELTRLLLRHPGARLAFVTSDRWVGQTVAERTGLASDLTYLGVEAGLEAAAACQLVFLATPAESSLTLVPPLRARGLRVVDLSGSFRLQDASLYPRYYRFEHPAPAQLREAVYGLPELFGDQVRQAALVANPGCYATAAALSLAPLLAAGLVEAADVVVVAASGTTGAGRAVKAHLLGSEVMGELSVYKAGGVHQHTPEIEQTLSAAAGEPVRLSFTPLLAPMPRGILATCTARLAPGVGAEALRETLSGAYAGEPFVRVLPEGVWPRTGATLGSNACHLQVAADLHAGRAVVVSAIDNLGKGAAGQAVQCLNAVLGYPETEGFERPGPVV